ncbi:hypothetical protein B0A50_04328 [Salinomyces thailandicus]|uniref:Ran-binding-domain-containing protein n=1 Tax=Salinomyces thailandicus TaxID=706561 RepID=A0A4U0TXU4_9PEZI|nr:hypothetical protein B0A50_04328 [Salinomyces thailandica]
MDVLLKAVTSQTVNFAIRSGITLTTSYALKQCGRLLRETPRSQAREALLTLQIRLESKIRIISPAIDMIELISARGNSSLESAVALTKDLRYEIQKLGARLSAAANEEELLRRRSKRATKSREESDGDLRAIVAEIKLLLERVEDAIPLINLAITTSGVNLSTKLSGSISPSRLLQASTFLTAADGRFAVEPGRRQQVGPTWTVSLYMLFAGHAGRVAEEGGAAPRETTWKEVVHKARVKLVRVPLDELYCLPGTVLPPQNSVARPPASAGGGGGDGMLRGEARAAEYAYQLLIIEDLDDDRVHTFEDDVPQPGRFEDVPNAGIRDIVPIHEVSKIFYADTGKILGIGGESEVNSPVLLFKRDVHAQPPRRMLRRDEMERSEFRPRSSVGSVDEEMERSRGAGESGSATEGKEAEPSLPHHHDHQQQRSDPWRLPPDLDPEWMALEVFTEETSDSDSDSERDDDPASPSPRSHNYNHLSPDSNHPSSSPDHLSKALSNLHVPPTPSTNPSTPTPAPSTSSSALPPIKTSLSLLEMLCKLTSLQHFRQASHLAIEDELLNFFLESSATAGAGAGGIGAGSASTGGGAGIGVGALDGKERRQRVRGEARRRVGFDPYDESPVKGERGRDRFREGRGGEDGDGEEGRRKRKGKAKRDMRRLPPAKEADGPAGSALLQSHSESDEEHMPLDSLPRVPPLQLNPPTLQPSRSTRTPSPPLESSLEFSSEAS